MKRRLTKSYQRERRRVKGETLHTTFSLLCYKNGRDIQLNLKGEKLKSLLNRFKDITHITLDEYSMLSQCMLAQIDTRLRQATGHNVYFGGISMILIGDPGQLLPVGGSPLYQYPTKSTIASH